MEQDTHFSVTSKFIVDLARQLFHFERKTTEAIEMLKCFRGISSSQIGAILDGDATIIDSSNPKYFEVTDMEFKIRLKTHREYLDSKYVTLAGIMVPREMLERYFFHVSGRLQDSKTGKLLDAHRIMGLEELRRDLHNEILRCAGLIDEIGNRRDREHENYDNFIVALSEWMHEVAPEYLKNIPAIKPEGSIEYVQALRRKQRAERMRFRTDSDNSSS
ncbi:MAG: hypothetical protein PHW62_00795 [Candidatus Ratteibacteria bacterium]|nr:hypothetical protein [Candidatus Ratteibacteria bacterium]